MKTWKVSIVVPTRNQADTLAQTIESVLGQSHRDLELLVFDGASTDETVSVLQRYESDPRLRWVSEPDRGQSHAINKGLAACTGEIFNWLNSDDYLHSDALREIVAAFAQAPAPDLVAGYTDEFRDQGPVFNRTQLQLRRTPEETMTVGVFCQPSIYWRTAIMRELRGVREDMHYSMDVDLWLRYLLAYGQERVRKIDRPIAFYRHHAAAKSSREQQKFYVEAEAMFHRLHMHLGAPAPFLQPERGQPDADLPTLVTGPHFQRDRYLGSYCERRVRVARRVDPREASRWLLRSFCYRPWLTLWRLKMALRLGAAIAGGLRDLPRRLRHSLGKRLRPILFRAWIFWVRKSEQIAGPRFLSALLLPLVVLDFLRRLPDYRHFRKMRAALPASLRRGSALAHYFTMVRTWQESLALVLLYDRLGSPRWIARLTVAGTLADHLPQWKERPVVLAYLHTGGFGFIRFVLRARGLPVALLGRALPEMLETGENAAIRRAGDERYGFTSVPHFFFDTDPLRPVVRYLQPGHLLVLALDGGPVTPDRLACTVGGSVFHLKETALRFARLSRALLVPVSAQRRGAFRFELRFGPPVPEALLQTGDTASVLQHLVRGLLPGLEEDPNAITWSTLEALVPELAAKRTAWP
jgi:glycosyltransferase involved in cell wall biosynthesis